MFGMTASPLDTKTGNNEFKVHSFFAELERNLDAKVWPSPLSGAVILLNAFRKHPMHYVFL